jgi:hypothetical protein
MPELAIPIMIFMIEGCRYARGLLKHGFPVIKLSHHFESLRCHHDLLTGTESCVKKDFGYVPFVVFTITPFPLSWVINWIATRVTRRVPLEEQELLTLRDTWVHLLFFGGSYCPCRSFARVHVFVVPCCDVHYEFHVKRCYVRLYSSLFCREIHVLSMLFVFNYTYLVSNTMISISRALHVVL